MAFYIPGGFGQVRYRLALVGDPEPIWLTTAWAAATGTVILTDVVNGVHAAFKTLHQAMAASQYEHRETEVTYVAVTGDEPFIQSKVETQAGGGATNTIPQNSAYMIRKNTGFGGRANKGRMFYPGVGEASVDNNGGVLAATITAWNTALATYLTSFNNTAGVEQMVLLHNPRTGNATPNPTAILSLTCDPVIVTQRRRLRR